MSNPNNAHITQRPDGRWNVKSPGKERARTVADTQAAAIQAAKPIVGHKGGGEVVVHRPDGTIRDSITVKPGNDPFPPRDKN